MKRLVMDVLITDVWANAAMPAIAKQQNTNKYMIDANFESPHATTKNQA
jgi:hypothetical protein